MTDSWDRNYSSAYSSDGLVNVHTYEYLWQAASARFAVRNGKRQSPFPYTPTERESPSSALQLRWQPAGASGDVVEGICYTRLNSAPTFSSGWTGGERETIQIFINASPGGAPYAAFWGDENYQQQAWEVGASDFSTALPTWPWQRTPTHFALSYGNETPIMCAPGDLTGLHARSEEIAHGGAIATDANHPRLFNSSYNHALNMGPLNDRMAPWLRIPTWSSSVPGAIAYRRPSDGGLLASMFYPQAEPGIADLSIGTFGAYGIYEWTGRRGVRLVDFHFSTLPTYRARVWGYWGDYGSLDGTWAIAVCGRSGVTYQYVTAPYTVGADPYYEATCDSTLDLNSLTYPDGTSHIYVGFDPYLDVGSIHMSCIEGEDNVSFPSCGTRSDIGGSVYVPGRMIRVGTVADDGAAT